MDIQIIQNKIYEIRGQRVMLDRDLAELYGVTTGNLNKAVKRNIERFPERFMFQLTEHEFLRFQNGISSWGGTRKLPYVFTEQGVSMLSAVLPWPKAHQGRILFFGGFFFLPYLNFEYTPRSGGVLGVCVRVDAGGADGWGDLGGGGGGRGGGPKKGGLFFLTS